MPKQKVKKSTILTTVLYNLLQDHYPEASPKEVNKEFEALFAEASGKLRGPNRSPVNPRPSMTPPFESELDRYKKNEAYWAKQAKDLEEKLNPPQPENLAEPELEEEQTNEPPV